MVRKKNGWRRWRKVSAAVTIISILWVAFGIRWCRRRRSLAWTARSLVSCRHEPWMASSARRPSGKLFMPARNQRSSSSQGTVADEHQRIPNATPELEMIVTAARLCAIVASTFRCAPCRNRTTPGPYVIIRTSAVATIIHGRCRRADISRSAKAGVANENTPQDDGAASFAARHDSAPKYSQPNMIV